MGSIVAQKSQFIGQVGEQIGYKSGLALSVEDFAQIMAGEAALIDLFRPPFDILIRIRSEMYEELFAILLYKIGVTPTIERGFLMSVPDNPAYREMAVEVAPHFAKHLDNHLQESSSGGFNLRFFVSEVWDVLGPFGAEVALDMVDRFQRHLNSSPWSPNREFEWKDTRPLDELFDSEKLESLHGDYFDQRFIHFIHANFDQIGSINWRQFEGLTAEYLLREGYRVEIGPGRDDGNIDIRCWADDAEPGRPPTLLVQCKRQKAMIEKVVVKALWADMQEANAESGLIVTTSALAPGSRDVVTARNYRIAEANRSTLREWIAAMRTPGKGVFMGE